jgi:hypothetical protein
MARTEPASTTADLLAAELQAVATIGPPLLETVLAPSRKPFTALRQAVRRQLRGIPREEQPQLLRWLLAESARRWDAARLPLVIPGSVLPLYAADIERLSARVAETDDPAFYDLENEDYVKELAIATGRFIPVGRAYGDPGGRLPRRILWAGGPRQAARAMAAVARAGGFGPFLTLHLHRLSLGDRAESTWAAQHLRVADLVRANPRLRGEAGAGWMHDPRIATIAPHLWYITENTVAGGASLFFAHRDTGGTSGALDASNTRRRLFDEGSYIPEVWAYLWPRAALLRWAETVSADA